MRRALVAAIVCCLAGTAAADPSVTRAYRLINEAQMTEAAAEVDALVAARPKDGEVAFLDGYMKFLRGEYAAAGERLREATLKLSPKTELGQEARELRELTASTVEATRSLEAHPGKHFIVYAEKADAILVPYALEALDRAWEALAADFGDKNAEPLRVEILPEVADLSRVSPLTRKEIETSGTIALSKYNKLMIVSPRALITGYPWLDTLTHEYTHFVVTQVSRNTVPIWLHEGLAKYEERRWRGAGGGGLTPSLEHLLATGLLKKRLITFEEMHPSMAKLPSQEDTALAFAEVYMVIEYLVEKVGWAGIRKIVGEMRAGKSDAQAVSAVVGKPFDEFQRDWRAWLSSKKLRLWPGLFPTALKFRKNPNQKSAAKDDLEPPTAEEIKEERARKAARLGGMLRARARLRAATVEYEKAMALLGRGNPQVSHKLARTYLELGDADKAIATVEPALDAYPDQAGPHATLGHAYWKKGDAARAEKHLLAAVAISPFDPAIHCDLAEIYAKQCTSGKCDEPKRQREETACRALK
jgi:tetratricopeptide (TPR) repeat protein